MAAGLPEFPGSHGLAGRSFLKEIDLTPLEWHSLLALAAEVKAAKRGGTESRRLSGKNIVLLFEKTSTRTRCAFEVAAHDQGAHVTVLDPSSSQMGHKESVADTAGVLGRYYDGIQFRGKAQADIEILGAHAGVPVWNGLTDEWHPTQMLCDMLTMREHTPKADGEIAFAYLGDARNNVGNSLLVAGAMMGMDVRIVAPAELCNEASVVAEAERIAAHTGARITRTTDPAEGVRGADFVYTDVWVSLGEPAAVWSERIRLLAPYAVSMDVLRASGNPEVKFMHCLPAFHDRHTAVGEQIYQETGRESLEVSDEVFRSGHSIVFDQAENRMHTIKALMIATMAD